MSSPTVNVANPLQELSPKYGQSVWLDYIRRSLIASGELSRMVKEDGLGGVTSNPAIFEKAITGSTDYTEALFELQKEKGLDAMAIYERIAIKDIQDAADALRPVYDRTHRRDGYVSLEVSPFLAKDTEGTIRDARRLWAAVNRPNLMVKIPATPEGIPAIQTAIGEGININVTLLFAQSVYEQVAHAYIAGLEKWSASGVRTPVMLASVASLLRQPHRQHGRGRIAQSSDEGIVRRQTASFAQEPAAGKSRDQPTPRSLIRFTSKIFSGSKRDALAAKARANATPGCGLPPAPRTPAIRTCSM